MVEEIALMNVGNDSSKHLHLFTVVHFVMFQAQCSQLQCMPVQTVRYRSKFIE